MKQICAVVSSFINTYSLLMLLEFKSKLYEVYIVSMSKDFSEIEKKLKIFGLSHLKIYWIDEITGTEFSRDILFYTQSHLCVRSAFRLQKLFNLNYTESFEFFKNKKLQRAIMNGDPSLAIQSLAGDKFLKSNLSKDLSYPVIVKPIGGAGSELVFTSDSNEDVVSILSDISDPSEYIVEELIKGQMYTVDYFVTGSGELRISCPIKSYVMKDRFDWGDYGVHEEWVTDFSSELSYEQLEQFLMKTINVFEIKNTFVHHEFFYDQIDGFKTIELNGRIGGFRLKLYHISCNKNLVDLASMSESYLPNGVTCHYKLYSKNDGGLFKNYEGCPFFDEKYRSNIISVSAKRKGGDRLGRSSTQGKHIAFGVVKFSSLEEKEIFSSAVQQYINSGIYLQ